LITKELEGGFIAVLWLIATVLPVMLREETHRLASKSNFGRITPGAFNG